jgi:uncharacterized membrane protein YfcA
VNPYIVLASAVVGLLVGMTGAGGGALMTPMLILLFGIKPAAAISSDLVAAVVMRPFGSAVHIRNRTVNFRLVGWMSLGSVPMAFVGAYLLHLLGGTTVAQDRVEIALGAALLLGAAAMVLRYVLDLRRGSRRAASVREIACRPVPTLLIGMVGGVIVGMTSVGSGSLMIVLLLFLYPALGASQLVGTDLTQAVPLTLAAALGALVFGHVEFAVTTSIVIGSVPAVLVGSLLSARAPDRYIRPIIIFVIFASGLKYVGVGTTELGWVLCAVLLGGVLGWAVWARPWRAVRARGSSAPGLPARTHGPPPGAVNGTADAGGQATADGRAGISREADVGGQAPADGRAADGREAGAGGEAGPRGDAGDDREAGVDLRAGNGQPARRGVEAGDGAPGRGG